MSEERNQTELAFLAYFQAHAPLANNYSAEKVKEIEAAIAAAGSWTEEEWRISTWFTSSIKPEKTADRSLFRVTVECDAQQFTCLCPSIEKAFMFMSHYQHIIIYQFYSVGPPWA